LERTPLLNEQLAQLQAALPERLYDFLRDKRWFAGKARIIASIQIVDVIPVQLSSVSSVFVFARVAYQSGPLETYVLPLHADASLQNNGENTRDGIIVQLPLSDALVDPSMLRGLYDAIEQKSVFRGLHGEIRALQTTSFSNISLPLGDSSKPKVIAGEQSNSSSIFGNRSILKIFRRVQGGVNPELEVGRFLTERANFSNAAPLGGWLEYVTSDGAVMTLGVLQGFVPNDGDAWQYTSRSLAGFWRDAPDHLHEIPDHKNLAGNAAVSAVPAVAHELCGPYFGAIALLGQRTAELHDALASDKSDPAFAPEPFSLEFQRRMQDALTSNAVETFALLRSQLLNLPKELHHSAEDVLRKEQEVLEIISETLSRPLSGMRTRIHGDYHLGQVLCAAGDFVIIDFEGEPGRPISDRVVKRSPLQDVAGMLRSFHYAAFASLLASARGAEAGAEVPEVEESRLAVLAESWTRWASTNFLTAYFESASSAKSLPKDRQEISSLLRLHLLSKALFELSYELNNRPAWVKIPLVGILRLLEHPDQFLP
jgi:maltose alpha-D-glucosyltransferase / alpha-amylase